MMWAGLRGGVLCIMSVGGAGQAGATGSRELPAWRGRSHPSNAGISPLRSVPAGDGRSALRFTRGVVTGNVPALYEWCSIACGVSNRELTDQGSQKASQQLADPRREGEDHFQVEHDDLLDDLEQQDDHLIHG